ncbi:MAG: LCP family protein [Coriobacteriales bacterium]|nr:LCP family protein [Coriobacteriales bacterium]
MAAFVNGINQNIKLDSLALDNLKKVLVQPETPDDPYYMLILGSDSRNASDMGEGRSDTLILARIDPATPQVTLISIPRDTPIQLEGYGTQKINAAFAYGGEAGAVEAVSKFCGVPISHYVELDFTGVEDLVNLLGGVEVNVPVRVLLDDVRLEPGLQWLDGHQALIMSRCRSYPSGDFQRVVNQRILISAVAKRILASNPTELPGLVEELARCVKTDVGATDALDLMLKLRNLDVDAMYMATVPSYPAFHDGASFVDTQEPEFSEMMDRVRAGLDPGVPPDPDVKY